MLALYRSGVRRLGRVLGTDADFLFRGTFWLSLGSFAAMGVAFFLSILYARYLTKDVYGDYRYVLSLLSLFGIFTLPGIGTAMTRAVSRGAIGSYHRAHRTLLYASFSVCALGIAASAWYMTTGNVRLALALFIGSLLIPFVEGMGNWRALLDGLQLFREKSLYNTLIKITYGACMGAVVMWAYFTHANGLTTILLLVGTYYGVHGIANIILSRYVRSLVPKNAPEDSSAITYGAHMSLAGIFATAATYIDGVLVYNALGPAALAMYSFAIAPPEQLKSILSNTATVSYTKLSSTTQTPESLSELGRTLPRKVLRASLLSGGIVACYVIFAPTLFAFFLPKYISSVSLSQVFALSLVFFPFGVFHTVIDAVGDLKTLYLDRIISPLIQICCIVLFIPLWGLWGAIYARVAGRLINHVIAWVLFKKLTRTPNFTTL